MVKLEGISEELVIEMREGKAIPPPPVDTTTGESFRAQGFLYECQMCKNGVDSVCQPGGAELGGALVVATEAPLPGAMLLRSTALALALAEDPLYFQKLVSA